MADNKVRVERRKIIVTFEGTGVGPTRNELPRELSTRLSDEQVERAIERILRKRGSV